MKGRILVTGGTGQLGSYVLAELLSRGWEVVLAGRTKPDLKSDRVLWREVDLLQPGSPSGLAAGCEAVLHLALVSKSDCEREVAAARLLADEALAAGAGHFFYASSIRVYGPARGTVDETSPARPGDDYGRLKLRTEAFLQEHLGGTGTRLRVLRVGHVVSATSRVQIPHRVSPGFLLLWGRACPHYIHAEEAAAAIAHLLESRQTLRHGVYNVTRELESPRTYGELYSPYLPWWGRLAGRLFAAPRPLVHRLIRARPEARESRLARILERNLADEGWTYEGRPLEALIAGEDVT